MGSLARGVGNTPPPLTLTLRMCIGCSGRPTVFWVLVLEAVMFQVQDVIGSEMTHWFLRKVVPLATTHPCFLSPRHGFPYRRSYGRFCLVDQEA